VRRLLLIFSVASFVLSLPMLAVYFWMLWGLPNGQFLPLRGVNKPGWNLMLTPDGEVTIYHRMLRLTDVNAGHTAALMMLPLAVLGMVKLSRWRRRRGYPVQQD
jgi:hypothetical protein